MFFELGDPLPTQPFYLRRMHHSADSIYGLSVDKQLQLHKLALAPSSVFVIESCIALSISRKSVYSDANITVSRGLETYETPLSFPNKSSTSCEAGISYVRMT